MIIEKLLKGASPHYLYWRISFFSLSSLSITKEGIIIIFFFKLNFFLESSGGLPVVAQP